MGVSQHLHEETSSANNAARPGATPLSIDSDNVALSYATCRQCRESQQTSLILIIKQIAQEEERERELTEEQ